MMRYMIFAIILMMVWACCVWIANNPDHHKLEFHLAAVLPEKNIKRNTKQQSSLNATTESQQDRPNKNQKEEELQSTISSNSSRPAVVPAASLPRGEQPSATRTKQAPDMTDSNKCQIEMYNFCKAKKIHAAGWEHDVIYNCIGTAYDAFVERMKSFTMARCSTQGQGAWGKRRYPIPQDTTVLLTGNSHARQVMEALMCQAQDHVSSVERLPATEDGYGFSFRAKFNNNSTLVALTNAPIVYSPKWAIFMQDLLFDGRDLNEAVDAIIVGRHNGVPDSKGSSFEKAMLSTSLADVNFTAHYAPSFQDVISRFNGPVLHLGMFAGDSRYESVGLAQKVVRDHYPNRTNLGVVDSRQYVSTLGECGAAIRKESKCWAHGEDSSNVTHHKPESMHRCTGSGGGLPDLAAWDLIEDLYDLLWYNRTSRSAKAILKASSK